MRRFSQHKGNLFTIIIVLLAVIVIFSVIYYISSGIGHTAQQKKIFNKEFQDVIPSALLKCQKAVGEEEKICSNKEDQECSQRAIFDDTVECKASAQLCIKAIQKTDNDCAELFIEKQRILNSVELG